MSAEEILALGVKEYRKQAREEGRITRQETKNQRTAAQIANKYSVTEEEVMGVFMGVCESNWGCVRKLYQKKK
jgi:hypothetical protein